jgi:hypothetical protein
MASTPSREEIESALQEFQGNKSQAARQLGISRGKLRYALELDPTLEPVIDKPHVKPVTIQEKYRYEQQIAQLKTDLSNALEQDYHDEQYQKFVGEIVSAERTVPGWVTPRSPKKVSAIAGAELSDIHHLEVVNPLEIEGVNSFNRRICEQRLERFFFNVVRLGRDYTAGVKIDGLVLAMLGDMLSGDIHEDLAESNEGTLYDGLLELWNWLEAGIHMLLDFYPTIHIVGVVGNHPRSTKKPRMKKRAQTNLDWLLYQLLIKGFKGDDRVTFEIGDGADVRFRIYKHRFVATHGDQFRGGSGIAGALSPMMLGDHRKRKRAAAMDLPFDYLLLGHWHQLMLGIQGMIANGSIKGYDEYGYIKNMPYEPPQQAFFLVDPDHGVTVRAPIRCKHPKERW